MRAVSLREAIEDVDELSEAPRAFGLPLLDTVGHAAVDMELEDRHADAIHGRLGRRQLLQDLDAPPRLLDHPSNTPNLPFDAVQPHHDSLLMAGIEHPNTI